MTLSHDLGQCHFNFVGPLIGGLSNYLLQPNH